MDSSRVKLESLLNRKADFDERYQKTRNYFTDIRNNPEDFDFTDFRTYEDLEQLIIQQSNLIRQERFRRSNMLNISKVLERNSTLFNDYRIEPNFKSASDTVLQTLFGLPIFEKQITPPRVFKLEIRL